MVRFHKQKPQLVLFATTFFSAMICHGAAKKSNLKHIVAFFVSTSSSSFYRSPPPSTGTKRRHPLRHADNKMNKSITCIASTTQKHQRAMGITHRDDSGACNNIDDLKPKTLFN